MRERILITVICAAGAVGTANASFADAGSNDTILTAQSIGSFAHSFSELGEGTITAGDVDWFSFTLTNGADLQFGTLASGNFNTTASMQLVGIDGTTIIASGQSTSSPFSIGTVSLAAGTYYIGVAGGESDYASSILDGQDSGGTSSDSFSYKMTVTASVAPLPVAAWAGLGLLIPMGIKRRMNRRHA